ncbi:MAG: hypothetical protein GXY55_13935 [Phycisphaerae bacterium]|mgnify:CR=1 FL=1|nr:hypothetical protein [Phycisphaerae bacterium]
MRQQALRPALLALGPALAVVLVALGQPTPAMGNPNTLALEVSCESLFVQPGEPVVLGLDVSNLAQMINGCQALIGYNSTYLTSPHSVAPGGGFWTELIYESWHAPGELDTAIGLQLEGGPTGTQADATIATITLTAGTTEGATFLVFRSDTDDRYATMLSDLNAEPVWPFKIDSQPIVIDGTPPVLVDLTATQNGVDVLDCANPTVQGLVSITVDAADVLAGLEGIPSIDITGPETLAATLTDDEGPSFGWEVVIGPTTPQGTYTIAITATDRAGNETTATGTLCVDPNQITGTVQMSTLSGAAYGFDREVVFKATDTGNTVLQTWTVTVTFTNNPVTRTAAGSYVLTLVPGSTARLSAKTDWSLRKRIPVTLDTYGQGVANFTLTSGDLDGSNTANILDYSILKANWMTAGPAGDYNGDSQVMLLDYSLLKNAWFTTGDPE